MQECLRLCGDMPDVVVCTLRKKGLRPGRLDLWQYLWEDGTELDEFVSSIAVLPTAVHARVLRTFEELRKLALSRPGRTYDDHTLMQGIAEQQQAASRAASSAAGLSLVAELERLRILEPRAKERRVFKHRLSKKLSEENDPAAREKLEAVELDRWAGELASEIALLGLPRARHADLATGPRRSLLRAVDASRFRTIRARLRKWQEMRKWLFATFQVNWPLHAGQVVDYLEFLAAEL